MKITDLKPRSPQLQPYISCYKIVEADRRAVNTVLPGTSLALSFRLSGGVSYVLDADIEPLAFSTLAGMRKTVRHIRYAPHTKNVIVLFRESGAAPFFDVPLNVFYNQTISLDEIVNRQSLIVLEEQLLSAKELAVQINIIEDFLLSILRPAHDALVEVALQQIIHSSGLVQMKKLSSGLYISQDAFEKRFRKFVGTSPKQFAVIVRMRSAIENCTDTSDAIAAYNFYDASHFHKEFKLFTGHTPAAFFKSPLYW